ncbi:hypothetical protein Thimo_2568 [Thioflavicoccus mobilis 8321]|uniref:Acetyltransferase n=1 Tax=Thioflavicoccus mobilis 8321 TaxID=765912 RepID=L0GZQ0_9GAMM|nr:hypothetical protein [Thioflavicoccus mobilis]AGA91292.1 hypothetical protein Thimo_2568 [Thioflavicoccus mobilis 8321]
MFLKQANNDKLVEVLGLRDLFNPLLPNVVGRYHAGEEVQEAETFAKNDLVFQSGEPLPKCWTDVHYRDDEVHAHH